MTAATQHDFHPDAEVLNAFAERALPEWERSQVLSHLAVCGRCRQVLTLAQQAIGVGVAELEEVALPAAATPPPPGAWWRRWRLVWVPAAVAAAFTVASISIYLRQTDHSDKTIMVEVQPASPNLSPAAAPSQEELAKAAPPAPTPLPSATARTRLPAQSKTVAPTTNPAPLPPPAPQGTFDSLVANAAPPRSTTQTVTVAQEQSDLAPVSPTQQPETAQLTPAGSPALYKTQPRTVSPEQQQTEAKRQLMLAEQKKQMEAAAARNGLFDASAAQQSVAQDAIAGAAASTNNSAASYNQQLEMRAGSAAGFSSLHGSLASRNGSLQPIHLPSGLALASFASAGHRAVAIDTAGAVFVGEDSKSAWKPVKLQWTGRAILVRTQTPPLSAPKAAQATATNDKGSVAAPSAPPPAPFFEIVNDKNQTWQSTDGATWTAK